MKNYFVPDEEIDRMAIERAAKVHGIIVVPNAVDIEILKVKAQDLGLYDQIENIEYWYKPLSFAPRIYLYADKIFEEMNAGYNIDSIFMESH